MESLFWAVVIEFAVIVSILWGISAAVDDLRAAVIELPKAIKDGALKDVERRVGEIADVLGSRSG